MDKSLHIAFIVGLLLLLTKVADFLFLQKQKDAIEKSFKLFHSIIKELNPTKWLSFLKNDNLRFFLALIGCLLLVGFIFYNFWNEIKFFWTIVKEVKFLQYFLYAAVAYGIKFINGIDEYIWEDIPDWLIDANNAYKFIFRYIILIACYFGYNLVIYFIFYLFVDVFKLPTSISTIILGLLTILNCLTLIFSFYIVWLIIIFLPIFILSIILIIFSFLLSLVKMISVRVIEYNKGIFAALVLVITTILGLIEFFMKS